MHRKGRNPSLFSWSLLFTETSGFIRDGWGRIPLLRRSLHVREVEGNSQTQSNLSTCNLLFQPLWETKTQRRCQKYEWNFWQTYISPPTTGIKVKLLQFWVFFGGGRGGGIRSSTSTWLSLVSAGEQCIIMAFQPHHG